MSKANCPKLNWLWTSPADSVLVTHRSDIADTLPSCNKLFAFFKQRTGMKRKLTFREEMTPHSLDGKLLGTLLGPLNILSGPHRPRREGSEGPCTGFTYPELLEFLQSQALRV